MKTLNFIFAFIAVVTLSSCNFDISLGQVDGNGNVVTEERSVADFTKVKGAAGIDVYLTEGTENKVTVEADENLMELIETEVEGGKLRIRAIQNIGRAKAKKVHVTYVNLSSIEASSGADVIGNSVIKSETLNLDTSSGADLEASNRHRRTTLLGEHTTGEEYISTPSTCQLSTPQQTTHCRTTLRSATRSYRQGQPLATTCGRRPTQFLQRYTSQ